MRPRSILVFASHLISASVLIAQPEVVPAKVYVVPLREDVDRYLGVFLGRSLEKAEMAGVERVLH